MESRIMRSVSATQLVRDLAAIRTLATDGPVGITSHNRTELVMLSAQRFTELTANGFGSDPAELDAKLTTVLDGIDTHVAILDGGLKVRRINRAMRLTFGIENADLCDTPFANILPAANAPFIVQRLKEVAASGKVAEFDFPSIVLPGRTIHARMIPWPGGVAYFGDDITDRISAIERDLGLEALRTALTSLGGGSGSIDETGKIVGADDGLAKLIGADKDQIVGRRFVSLFDPAQRAQIETAIGAFGKSQVIDVSFLHKGVAITHARLALAPYFAGDGRSRLAFVVEDRALDG